MDNLVVLVEKNNWQSGGAVCDIMGAYNMADRFRAFNWDVQDLSSNVVKY